MVRAMQALHVQVLVFLYFQTGVSPVHQVGSLQGAAACPVAHNLTKPQICSLFSLTFIREEKV
jgi:hypothetical protein